MKTTIFCGVNGLFGLEDGGGIIVEASMSQHVAESGAALHNKLAQFGLVAKKRQAIIDVCADMIATGLDWDPVDIAAAITR